MFFLFLMLFLISGLTCTVVSILGIWASFTKANRPGWAALIPIYNLIVFIDIAGKPWWWLFLTMIPIAGIYFGIVLVIDFCRGYGKSVGFAIGLILLPFAFWPLLGFDDSEYFG